jgi:anti-sigma factor RsiW
MDGELETSVMLEVEAHLDECESCRSLLALKKRFKLELKNIAKETKTPKHLEDRIIALSRRKNILTSKVFITGVSLAAAALLLFVLYPFAIAQNNSGETARVLDDVINRHIKQLPMEVTTHDPSAASSWFRDKVDFPVHSPLVKLKNASFQGARVSNVQSEQAAHMIYNVDGHRVTLMIFPLDKLKVSGGHSIVVNGRQILTGTRRGYNVAIMKKGDMAYAVSSDMPVKKLASFLSSK